MVGGETAKIDSENIKKDIENLLQDRFEMPEYFEPGGEEDDFFGLRGLLHPRELSYLAYILEQRYGIQFSMEDYDNSRFYSLSGLSEIVAGLIKKQSSLGGNS